MNHLHRLIQTAAITAPFLAASIACAGVAIRYDSCGFRSLEWDAVAGAATYKVERRVCDGCVGEWSILALTQELKVADLDSPAATYRVRALSDAGVILATESVSGDGVVVARLSLTPTQPELPILQCGETFRIHAEVTTPVADIEYSWRRNGVLVGMTTVPHFDIAVTAEDAGAEYSVVAATPCGSASGVWAPICLAGAQSTWSWRWTDVRMTSTHASSDYYWTSCCSGSGCSSSSSTSGSSYEDACTQRQLHPSSFEINAYSHYCDGMSANCGGSINQGTYCCTEYRFSDQSATSWTLRADLQSPGTLSVFVFGTGSCTIRDGNGDLLTTNQSGEFSVHLAAGKVEILFWESSGTWCGYPSATLRGSFSPDFSDCNANLRPDASDIYSGTSVDIDSNGVPDECQTLSVPGQYATIQAAIDAAPSNELRIVSVAAGTYPGPVAFNGKPVIVRGADAASTVITGNGGQPLSVVRFTGGEPAITSLERVTVRGGTTGTPIPSAPQYLVGGGIFGIDTAASVRDCVVEQNAAGFGGGAYFLRSTGEVLRTVFRNNGAGSDGGGFQSNQGSQRLTDVIIDGNACSSRGGGMHLVQGRPTLTRVTVRNNHSNDMIGGISWYALGSAAASAMVEDCVVTGNSALVAQGGIGISAPATGTPTISLRGTDVCSSTPQPNISGAWTDLGGNRICDCAGDLNGDRRIDGGDIGMLLSSWGYCGSTCPSDINRDGKVNGADLGFLLADWGSCGS